MRCAVFGLVMSVVLSTACGGEPRAKSPAPATATATKAQVQGPIVARVDGEPVSLDDVQQTVLATGLSPAEALGRIEAEALLAEHARRTGYGGSKKDERAIEAARVRVLLRVEIERGTAPEQIPAAAVKERFEQVRKKRDRPEGRAVLHVLFRVEGGVQENGAQEQKARLAAQQLLDKVRSLSAQDVRSALESYPPKSERDGLPIVRERIGDARKGQGLAAPFEQAIFATSTPQLIREIVRTSFGYHVIFVEAIVPAESLNFGDAESAVRQALSTEIRAKALETLLARLKAEGAIQYHEAAIRKGLSDDKLLGEGM